MDKIVVGKSRPLIGDVTASGAKNSALPILFGALLAEGTFRLSNVPRLRDIQSTADLMISLGCEFVRESEHLVVKVPKVLKTLAHYDLVRKMRASILALGPLLSRMGRAEVSLPGGCAIGARPINFHLEALKKMGASIEVTGGYVNAKAKKLRGCKINFPFASVGGTENILMAACLAEGTTYIENAAKEPEIVDHVAFLKKMGAKIQGEGTSTIEIQGVDSLSAVDHEIIPDRIEAGTLLIAGAISGGDIRVKKCRPDHLQFLIKCLKQTGCEVDTDSNSVALRASKDLHPVSIVTAPHPGFATDLQAQWMTLMTQAEGCCEIREEVFENRFMHVQELARMNANIDVSGRSATINGTRGQLRGAPVMATDLRASASLVLAGLVAEGTTTVQRVYHLDRGYEHLETKLSKLGGKVRRIK